MPSRQKKSEKHKKNEKNVKTRVQPLDFYIIGKEDCNETEKADNVPDSGRKTPNQAIHADRTPGSDCDHRDPGGNFAAGVEPGQEHGETDQLSE